MEKTHLTDEQVITRENVKELGEKFAVSAIRNMRRHHGKKLDRLYNGLKQDIFNRLEEDIYTDGYEIAQECICYLCENIDHMLGDKCLNIYGEEDTIRLNCYKVAYSYIRQQLNLDRFVPLQDNFKYGEDIELPETEDLRKVRKIKKQLGLTEKESEIFKYLIDNVPQANIANILGLTYGAVKERKKNIKNKYLRKIGFANS